MEWPIMLRWLKVNIGCFFKYSAFITIKAPFNVMLNFF